MHDFLTNSSASKGALQKNSSGAYSKADINTTKLQLVHHNKKQIFQKMNPFYTHSMVRRRNIHVKVLQCFVLGLQTTASLFKTPSLENFISFACYEKVAAYQMDRLLIVTTIARLIFPAAE